MTWFDYAALAIVGMSILLSVIHGLVRELMALLSWVAAFLGAQHFALDAAGMLANVISHPALRLLVGFVAVFVVLLVAMTLLTIALSRFVKSSGLGALDRLLGALFGLVRGVAIMSVVVLLAGLTALPEKPAWRQAMLSTPFVALANVIKVWLPHDISKHINYG